MAATPRSRYFALAHRYVSVAIYNGDLPRLDGLIPCEDCGFPAKPAGPTPTQPEVSDAA